MILKPLSARYIKNNLAQCGLSQLAKIISPGGSTSRKRVKRNLFATSLCLLFVSGNLSICQALPSEAKSSSKNSGKTEPAGTLLHPLVPKLDESPATETSESADKKSQFATPIHESLEYDINVKSPAGRATDSSGVGSPQMGAPEKAATDTLKAAPENISPELGKIDESSLTINEDTTLKGTIQIVADDTEYDQQKNTFLGTGNAVAIIAGQNSKLEADMIMYDQNTELMDARGNVRIYRDGQVTTGSAFKFKVNSDEYLITNPDTEVQGTSIVARKAYGTDEGLNFRNGTMKMPKPITVSSNIGYAPLNYQDELFEKRLHPDAYIPENASFKFSARKMVYERYKDHDNLTVFGGRMMFGKLGVKLPKFTATVGQENNVVFPITPYIGNNMMSGGLNLGPNFHRSLGKYGVLSYAPLIQLGGRRLEGTTSETKNLPGVGAQIGFQNQRLQAHLAYGSNSDLLIGDLKYKISRTTRYQGGVNRFMEDGLFGFRRARILSEFVDLRSTNKIPFLSSLSFRTAAGWAQDNPQLINLTPEYAKLFNKSTSTKTVSAYRFSETLSASTHPLFKIGNEKYGVSSNLSGGLALRYYSTGDAMAMAQIGPNVEAVADRFKIRVGYTQSAIRGESPFVFDQFIQGTRSAYVAGGFRVSKYLTLGGSVGYNFIDKLAYSKSMTAAIGPQDFKLLLSRDFLTGNQRMGFDLIYGQQIPFNRLVLKGSPDHGQLGGI
ncbi:MAG: hypothetical protein DKT66_19315 [Candidatus Melainabacteria bacterium]|nr:MAG: hypothetical protein DKT66_19315 [Candidatus Melainabacteria bacterium]